MANERLARTVLPLTALLLALFAPPAAAAKKAAPAPVVQAGAAAVDATYRVGNSAGQYAPWRSEGWGDVDPHFQQTKNQASYGVQSRLSTRALVVKGTDGQLVALVSNDHYIPQDAMWRRTAQILDQRTGGLINSRNLTMAASHNHSSPSYSALTWGPWAFQDVVDLRFFDYHARRNAEAVLKALDRLRDVRVSATALRFDAFHKNPMGPGWSDYGTPHGYPRPYTDHDLSVIHFEALGKKRRSVATLFNIGQHPEFLEGYNLVSGEYTQTTNRFVDRTVGGVTIFTQNATGTSEVEEDRWHDVHDRQLFNHAQYAQMEWGARQLADAVIGAVRDIREQRPNSDDTPTPYGGTSYRDRFIPWMSRFPVAIEDRWFPGPVSHPYPGVSNCRTDGALGGNPRIPVIGLPDCTEAPLAKTLSPATDPLGGFPGITTDTLAELGIPVPENYSVPSTGSLQDTAGVHMQAFRLGDILFPICSCEQWVDQSLNIKTRTDTKPGNEYLGYDPTAPDADPTLKCTPNSDGTHEDDGSGTGTWNCQVGDYPIVGPPAVRTLSDRLVQHMRAQILNDAAGWDDPNCNELGCGYQAEAEPTDLTKIRGNFTHDDTAVRGGKSQTRDYAATYGYKLVVPVAMANDYNGYIASYREYMNRDHYRKALTGWGSHSSDYFATRLAQMGRALKGDTASRAAIDGQTDPAKADPAWAPFVAKEAADQAAADAKTRAAGEAAAAAVQAYPATMPDDGGSETEVVQPKDIERFDAATFTWDGGNNYTDNPQVTVERNVGGDWVPFADQSGEVPVTVEYPYSSDGTFDPEAIGNGAVGYRAGGQAWKWTATFEAFVSQFPLVDPRGKKYRATPAGRYRFVVKGLWRRDGADTPYTRVSRAFEVAPWSGLTVEDLAKDAAGHVTFRAGPSRTVQEQKVRGSARPPLAAGNAAVPFTIGPVDFPDVVRDQKATGARFLNSVRGYSATSPTDVEHYCVDCSFRPWLDATSALVATVTIERADGSRDVERIRGDHDGSFESAATLAAGDRATVSIRDAWGNTTREPAAITH